MAKIETGDFDARAGVSFDGRAYIGLRHKTADIGLSAIELAPGSTRADAEARAAEINACGRIELTPTERWVDDADVVNHLTLFGG